jgi:hypothetical protein
LVVGSIPTGPTARESEHLDANSDVSEEVRPDAVCTSVCIPLAEADLEAALDRLTRALAMVDDDAIPALVEERRALREELREMVLVCTNAGAARLRAHAPNVWSWIGGRCFRLRANDGIMNVAERLESLRARYGWDDAELARRVEAGEVPLDPILAEWLILSGRGDLIAR